jgi:hypothetical protein
MCTYLKKKKKKKKEKKRKKKKIHKENRNPGKIHGKQ